MADALCGPSNALQQFSKHHSADRSLQQDRLAAARSPEESFRSLSDGNLGSLDHDFAAFEAGHGQQDFTALPPPYLHDVEALVGPSAPAEFDAVGWANDFQKLHISDRPEPRYRDHLAASASSAPAQNWGWHDEFLRQEPAMVASSRSDVKSDLSRTTVFRLPQWGELPPVQPFHPLLWQPARDLEAQSRSGQVRLGLEVDEADLESAFEAAGAAMQYHGLASLHEGSVRPEAAHSERPAREVVDLTPEDLAVRIGADTIPDSRADQSRSAEVDRTELALAAGQLLENVKHDQSQKFQNSTFLGLMRQLRDGEAIVEGTDIVQSEKAMPGDDVRISEHIGVGSVGSIDAYDMVTGHA